MQRDNGILHAVGDRRRSPERFSGWRRWLWTGERTEPEPAYRGLYEPAVDPDRIGVCCSGGGIRSAAFNLGALQALQQAKVLQRTRYLSAVSGGSYIASAFTMVAKSGRAVGHLDESLFNDRTGMPLAPGTPEEQYLRNHLSYLAPDGSAKVYLGLRLIAGLLVNILLIGLPGLLLGLLIGLTLDGPYDGIGDGHISVPHGVLYPVLGLGLLAALAALLDILWRPRKDSWRRANQTWEVRLFVLGLAGAVALIAVPALAALASHLFEGTHPKATAAHGVRVSFLSASGSIVALAGAAIAHVRGIVKDHARIIEGAQRKLGKYLKAVREALIATVVMLAGPMLLVAVATFGVLLSVQSADKGLTLLLAAAALLLVMLIFVDLTAVSLHPLYRRRLAAAFALERDGETAQERPFDKLVVLSETDVGDRWPMLIVCAAANVSEPGATPPGRRVASFTFSPTAIGGPLTGATETTHYENLGRNRRRDVTLPAAVAMSGAALSPAMGKLTFRPLSFLLAMANIRLGVWVPNPQHINQTLVDGDSTLAPSGMNLPGRRPEYRVSVRHRPRPWYLWKEVFGRNRLDDKFLYITDGGHYENLGLVELLRRGCRTIYCFDAGGGATENALGDAIALARTELDVEICMSEDTSKLQEDDKTHRSELVCASGTIRYPAEAPEKRVTGELFYVRSVVSEKSPWELRNYQLEDGIFPHHSTFDQFFTDQRFEAYRRLGMFAAESALEMQAPDAASKTVTAMIVKAETYSASGRLVLELDPDG